MWNIIIYCGFVRNMGIDVGSLFGVGEDKKKISYVIFLYVIVI